MKYPLTPMVQFLKISSPKLYNISVGKSSSPIDHNPGMSTWYVMFVRISIVSEVDQIGIKIYVAL